MVSIQDQEYIEWIADLSKRFMQSQVKTAVRVNQEMLRFFYWLQGFDITDLQFDNRYGSHFYENLSRDLVATLGVKKGFSPSTLKYTKYLYNLYSPLFINRQQSADESINTILQQPADDFNEAIYRQPAEDFELLLLSHGRTIRRLLSKCKVTARKRCSLSARQGRINGDAECCIWTLHSCCFF